MTDPAEVVRAVWERFEARDWDGAAELVHRDVIVEWPHTRERIRGRDAFIAVNREYPGGWTISVLTVVGDGERVASEVRVDHGDEVFFAASFYELRDGLIERATEYWVTSPYEEPAAWRSPYAERY